MLEKYLSHTVLNKETNCLEWQRCLNTDGYPRASNKENRNLKVHREVFFLVHGYYPKVVRHTCDNIICINPDHLLPGNSIDNVRDRHERGRTHNQVDDIYWKIIPELRNEGLSYKEIAEKLQVKVKFVDSILYRLKKEARKEG